jgi:hypothetical protein
VSGSAARIAHSRHTEEVAPAALADEALPFLADVEAVKQESYVSTRWSPCSELKPLGELVNAASVIVGLSAQPVVHRMNLLDEARTARSSAEAIEKVLSVT